jgi:hypothetical protein
MGTRYNIMVTATDAATARVRAIKQGLGSIVAPITNVGKSVKALGKEVGIDKLAKGVGKLGSMATDAVKSIGGISPALAGVVGVGSLAAMAAYGKQLIYSQSATMRFAATTGVAAQRVQVLEGGAKLAGLQVGDMDGAIQNLGTTLQDARWGRNQGALMMMNRLGMRLKYTKNGAIDTEAAIGDLADAFGPGGKLAKAPVQTKMLVAQQFGVEALLPMLLQGRKAWEAYNEAAAKVKPPLSDDDLKRANEYRKSIDLMSLSFDGLGQSIEKSWFSTKGFWDWITQHNVNAQKNIDKYGVFGAMGHGAMAYGKDAIKAVGGVGKSVLDAAGLTPKAWRDLGNLISAGEGGYDSVNLGKRGGYKGAHVNLVESSIQSIMDAQQRGDFNAAGKFQMTKDTLAAAVKAMHLDTSQKFDQGMQERIFRQYLVGMKRPEIADYVSGKSNDLRGAVKAASKEWASVADPDTGQSHYAGIANNKASISADQMAAALKQARQDQQNAPEKVPGGKPYVMGSNPKAELTAPANGGPSDQTAAQVGSDGGDMGQVWQNAPKPGTAKVDGTLTLHLKGLPPGVQATVTDSNGPVKTILKTETSMPDFNL